MQLFVSLPENNLELARAAAEAGADALKVHMNVRHDASGTAFGTFTQEEAVVRSILGAVKVPVGLMPGADQSSLPTNEELTSLQRDGLDFIDIYAKHMPLRFIDLPLRLIPAFDHFDGLVEGVFYSTHLYWPPEANRNRIYMAEASIFPKEQYGQPFSYADYRRLRIFQEYSDVPLLVPTQKAITPDDAVWLKRTGSGALMIGAIVTGRTAESIATATTAYRRALDTA
jgi:hypothetical protein